MEHSEMMTPQLFFDTLTGFQRSEAIKSAVELDVFTRIGEGNKTAQAISDACGASERGTRILCDSLTVMGFLNKNNGEYELTEMSAMFLNRHSQAFVGDAAHFLMSPMQKRGFDDLTNAIRNGGSSITEEGSLDPESPMWVLFARGMTGMMMVTEFSASASRKNFRTPRFMRLIGQMFCKLRRKTPKNSAWLSGII
jgi:hypothetical protein